MTLDRLPALEHHPVGTYHDRPYLKRQKRLIDKTLYHALNPRNPLRWPLDGLLRQKSQFQASILRSCGVWEVAANVFLTFDRVSAAAWGEAEAHRRFRDNLSMAVDLQRVGATICLERHATYLYSDDVHPVEVALWEPSMIFERIDHMILRPPEGEHNALRIKCAFKIPLLAEEAMDDLAALRDRLNPNPRPPLAAVGVRS